VRILDGGKTTFETPFSSSMSSIEGCEDLVSWIVVYVTGEEAGIFCVDGD